MDEINGLCLGKREYGPFCDCSVRSGSSEGFGCGDSLDFFRFRREESSVGAAVGEWSSSSTVSPFFRFLDFDFDGGSASILTPTASPFVSFRLRGTSSSSVIPAPGVGSMAEARGSEVSAGDFFFFRLFFSVPSGLEEMDSGSVGASGSLDFFFFGTLFTISTWVSARREASATLSFFFFSSLRSNR
jgi:hypothetical protein